MSRSFAAAWLCALFMLCSTGALAQKAPPYFLGEQPKLGTYPTLLLTHDFDGDGTVDALVCNALEVAVLRGDGFGALLPALTVANSPPNFGKARLADVDADGIVDVIGVSSGTVVVLKSHGDGTFTPFTVPTGPGVAVDAAFGNLDGTGFLDVVKVTPGPFGGLVAVVLLGDASGTYTYAATAILGASLHGHAGVQIFDTTGIGMNDVVTSDAQGVAVSSNLGGGLFGTPQLMLLNGTPSWFADGDFDADGRTDLAVFLESSPALTVLRGTPLGLVPVSLEFGATSSARPVVADIDADGDVDLLSSNEKGLQLRRNDGTGALSAPIDLGGNDAIGLQVHDVDYDGIADVIQRAKTSPSLFSTSYGRRDGTFDHGAASALVHPDPGAAGFDEFNSVSCDVDGNGVLDLAGTLRISSGLCYATYFGNGVGGFSAAVVTSGAMPAMSMVTGDVTGDGRDDLIAVELMLTPQVTIHPALASGTFAPPTVLTFNPSVEPRDVALVDMDLDGDLDLAVATPSADTVERYTNVNGNFTPTTPIAFVGATPAIHPYSIGVADIEGDGDDDMLLAATFPSKRVIVAASDGVGGSTPTTSLALSIEAPDRPVVIDVNADGLMDVVAVHTYAGTLHTFFGQSVGSFAPSAVIGSSCRNPKLADIDGDGVVDAVGCLGGLLFAHGLGTGKFDAPRVFLGAHTSAQQCHVADLDGDGRPDVVVTGAMAPDGTVGTIFTHGCAGALGTFGIGCPGAGGFEPKLALEGCPTPGGAVTFMVRDGVGGALCIVMASGTIGHSPIGGGCFLELGAPLPSAIVFALPGSGPGNGDLALPLTIPASVVGTIHLQGFVADASSGLGFATTPRRTIIVQ